MGSLAQQAVSHTPGPWVSEESKPVDGGGYCIRRWRVVAAGGEHVCDVPVGYVADGKRNSSVFGGNAHLIAAAPELLTACKRATNLLDTYARNMGSLHAAELVKQLDAAIAKATGHA